MGNNRNVFLIFIFIAAMFLSCATRHNVTPAQASVKRPVQPSLEPAKKREVKRKKVIKELSPTDRLLRGIALSDPLMVEKALKDGGDVNYLEHRVSGSPLFLALSFYKIYLDMSKLKDIGSRMDLIKELNLKITEEEFAKNIRTAYKLFSYDENSLDNMFNILTILIEYEADVNLNIKNGGASPFIYLCVTSDDERLVSLFLNNGADVNQVIMGTTPLAMAVYSVNLKTAELLLKNEADPNFSDKEKSTLLHYAVQTGKLSLVKMLVKRGAEVNTTNVNGQTPLWIALFYHRNHEVIQKGELKAYLDSPDKAKKLLEQLEIYAKWDKNYFDVVKFLLESGADINLTKEGEPSPLYYALSFNDPEIARFLMKKGVDISYEEKRVKALIEKGESEYYYYLAVIYFISDRKRLIESEIVEVCNRGVENACRALVGYYYNTDVRENIDYSNMLAIAEKLLEIDPENELYLGETGFYLIFNKKLDQAKKFIIRSIEKNGEVGVSYMNLGHILLLEGDSENANKNYDHYISISTRPMEGIVVGFEEDLKALVKYYPEKKDVLKKTIGEVIERIRSSK